MATLTIDDLIIPSSIHTLEGFRAWARTLDEDGPRIHYYRGEVHVEKMPQDWRTHLPLASSLNQQLGALARRLDLGRNFEQGGWITNLEAELSTEPDGILVLGETFESGAARIEERPTGSPIELVGRVDMALEVVSRSSAHKDLERLVEGYARAGVPEYWLVDARVEPRLTLLSLAGGTYHEVPPDADGWLASAVWRGHLRARFSRDRVGLPEVEVEHRPPSQS